MGENLSYRENLKEAYNKLFKAFLLLKDNVSHTDAFDPQKFYSPRDLETYDSMTNRFLRVYEVFTGTVLKSCDYVFEGSSLGELRDRLNRAEKRDILENVDEWINMRKIRNTIAHEYLPEKVAEMDTSIRKWTPIIEEAMLKLEKIVEKD